jgi:23S rRNA pseudouridine1911/1915/1917 synthase
MAKDEEIPIPDGQDGPPGDEAEWDWEEGSARRSFVIQRDLRKRLDIYLQQRLKGISRSRVQKLIDLGGVTVNGQLPKASTTIRSGDVVDVVLPAPAIRTIEPEPIPLDVLHEDDSIIVLNKQAGVIVHPARSHLSGTSLNGRAYRCRQQSHDAGQAWKTHETRGFRATDAREEPEPEGSVEGLSSVGATEFRPGIVHRLDKNTTGVLLIAKNDDAHWAIARQFEDRSTLKAYLAVVHGEVEGIGGVIDEPIGKHPTIREAFAVRRDHFGKPSVTLFRVRERYKGYTLVELELKTGRTHQIRVHLSYIGHPVAGDIVYGGEPIGKHELDHPPIAAGSRKFLTFAREKIAGQKIEQEATARSDLLIAHPALHAALLRIVHPTTQQPITFTAALHEPVRTLVRELRSRPAPGHPGPGHPGHPGPTAREGYWVDLGSAIPD